MQTKKSPLTYKVQKIKSMWYGIEKFTKYDAPQTTVNRFFNIDIAADWMRSEGRMDLIDDSGNSYKSYKMLYAMPWYWNPPTKKKAQAYLEEYNPIMKYYWSLPDIIGVVIAKLGTGVIVEDNV
jgi:hypothetical protein